MLPTAQPLPCSVSIGRHTKPVPSRRRHARGAAPAAARRPRALRRPAGRRRRARADRPAARRRPHARDHAPAADRGRQRYGIVACVSGRRASDARRIVSLGSIAYLGSHGSEVLRPGAIAPELDRELQAWTRRVQAFAHDAFGEKLRRLRVRLEDKEAIAALHWRGTPDEEDALARDRGGRRGGREGRLRHPLGPQGARDPPAGADRQGRRDRRPAARHRPRGRRLRRRRRDRPRRLPRPERAAGARPPRLRAARRRALGRDARRRSRRRPTRWSTAPTACAACCARC